MTAIVNGDLVLGGKSYRAESDLAVNGWVEIDRGGELRCGGDLTCLGVFVNPGGRLECQHLFTNFLAVDNSDDDTSVMASWIRARVVDLVQRGLQELVDRGDLEADYCQHHGGELNPSWDYVRGKLPVLPRFYERGGEELVVFDREAIRRALSAGEAVFHRPGPLLSLTPQPRPAPPPPVVDATVTELVAWIDSHPGPQRALLDALRAGWLSRLTLLDDPARSQAVRAIRRALRSPKVAKDLAALLVSLPTVDAAASDRPEPTAPEPPTVRLVRSAPARDYQRRAPGAWLAAFPVDAETISVSREPTIRELPAAIGEYARLQRLSLIGTRISLLPPELGRLARLERLDLQQNDLEALPEEIGRLTSLQHLSLAQNPRLSRLPGGLCDLTSLEQLSLDFTPVTALPDDFGRLQYLRYLGLHNCARLDRLPESFFALPRLASLYLHGTRLPQATLRRIRETFPACEFWSFFR